MDPALSEVAEATKRRSKSDDHWRWAIVAAKRRGIPIRDIGRAAGVSHTRVLQIVREFEADQSSADDLNVLP